MTMAQNNKGKKYKLGWKGIFYQLDAWLYATPDTPGFILIPIMVGLFIPRLYLSYLKVSTEGLTLHYWPGYQIQVKWEDIDHLGKCRFLGIIPCDALYLKRDEAKDKKAIIRGWGLAKKCIIPLCDFRGWPKGELAENIKTHVPHIFSVTDEKAR